MQSQNCSQMMVDFMIRAGAPYAFGLCGHGNIGFIDAICHAISTGRPHVIDAKIGADANPGGAGVWELPGLGVSKPMIGGRYEVS